jgi:hypothetical protein
MKTLRKLLAFTGLIVGFATCASADDIWTLNNVTFNRPGFGTNAANGSFTTDSLLNIVTWDITVTGSNTQANAHYTPAVVAGTSGPITGEVILDPTDTFLTFFFHQTAPDDLVAYQMFLDLYLASPLTTSGGSINLIPGNPDNPPWHASLSCPGCGTLDNSAGQPSIAGAAGVPEPSSLVLLASGAGLLGIGLLRRKRNQVC